MSSTSMVVTYVAAVIAALSLGINLGGYLERGRRHLPVQGDTLNIYLRAENQVVSLPQAVVTLVNVTDQRRLIEATFTEYTGKKWRVLLGMAR